MGSGNYGGADLWILGNPGDHWRLDFVHRESGAWVPLCVGLCSMRGHVCVSNTLIHSGEGGFML